MKAIALLILALVLIGGGFWIKSSVAMFFGLVAAVCGVLQIRV